MVIQSSSGMLEHYTYCGLCKKWHSCTDNYHMVGGHDLSLLNQPCMPSTHPASIVMSMVEGKMCLMNVADADIDVPDDVIIHKLADTKHKDTYADDSGEEFEFEWDGRNETLASITFDKTTVIDSLHKAKQLREL